MQRLLRQIAINIQTKLLLLSKRKYIGVLIVLLNSNGVLLANPIINTSTPIDINESSSSKFVVTVQATGTGTITYGLNSGADTSNFVIDPITGDLSFKYFPDYEYPGGRYITTTSISARNTYSIVVKATDDNGTSTKSITINVLNVDENPDPPRDFYVISQNKSNILNWTASASIGTISEYRIYRSEDSTTWSNIGSVPVGTITYTDNGLTNGKFYFYTVRAWNGINESVNSNPDASTPYEPEISHYMHFDGNDDYLVVSDSIKLMAMPVFLGTTLECWVRFDTITSDKVYILSRDYNAPNTSTPSNGSSILRWYSMYYDPDGGGAGQGRIIFEYNVNGTSTYQRIVKSKAAPVANTWYHIAGTYHYNSVGSQSSLNLYVNGHLQNSVTATNGNTFEGVNSTYFPAESRFVIGATTAGLSPFTYGNFLAGDICEVGYWSTEFDSSTIQSSMYTRFRGDEANLVGLWHLDTLFNNVIYDYDNLNFNAVIHGDVCPASPRIIAVNDTVSVPASTPSYVDVKENDTTTSPRQVVRTKILTGPLHGTASVINFDSINYNPDCFVGTDTIVYLICDTTFFHNPYQYSDTAIVIITVNDNPPVITSNGGGASAAISVDENSSAVTTVTSTDIDACHPKTYSLSGGADQAKFIINSSSGALSFISAPDFESPTDAGGDNKYNVTVQVSDGYLVDTQAITVTVLNINESPSITSASVVMVPENTTAVMTVTATDPDAGDTKTYSITGGTDQAEFTINGTTGALTFIIAPDYELPADANSNNDYIVDITVTDGSGLADTMTVTITVTNVNEPPSITSASTASVPENVLSVMTITSTDPDAGDSKIYSITGGTDQGEFTINGTTGALAFITVPDYELPTDANIDNDYIVDVTVTDGGGLTDTMTLTITVTNVNEPPSITNASTASVPENTTAVMIVSSTDPDAGDTKTYFITGGTDQAEFTINGTTGALAFITAPDYELPADANSNNDYIVDVTVTDSEGLADTMTLTITVTNVNEAPTDILLSNDNVDENLPVGTVVGIFSTVDPDAGDVFIYSFVLGGDEAAFAIVNDTLITNIVFDYSIQTSYTIIIRTVDAGGLIYEKPFTITINQINNSPSDIILSNDNVDEMQSIGTLVGLLSTVDPDMGDSHMYTFVEGGDETLFNISEDSLKTAVVFNFETQSNYTITIRTTDSHGDEFEKAFIIYINDINEAPTDISLSSNMIDENLPINTPVAVLTTTDQDTSDTHTYSFVSGSDEASFTFTGDTLVALQTFNYEIKSTYTITIRSTDSGGLFFEKSFTIYINNVNEAPVFTDIYGNPISFYTDSVPWNTTSEICLSATDEDGDDVIISVATSITGNGIITGFSGLCFTYEPNRDYLGTDSLRIIIADDGFPVLYDTLNTSLIIYHVNSAPIILDREGDPTDYLYDTTWENTPKEICVDVFDYDTNNVVFSDIRSLTNHVSISTSGYNDLCFLATPDSGFFGLENVQIIVADDGIPALYDTAILTLEVIHINRPPVILDGNNYPADTLHYEAYVNELTQICLQISDPDNDQISIGRVFSLDRNGKMTIQDNGNCLDYEPETDFIGLERFFVKACDNGVPSLCDSAILVINVRPRFIIPQAISPNGDGLNDTWIIDGIENYPDNSVIIFSRWGDIIYKAKGYDNVGVVWKGEFTNSKGAELREAPDGTYFYFIILNEKVKLSGYIVLKR